MKAKLTLVLIGWLAVSSVCRSEQFVADFADKPGMNYGTMGIETGVFALAGWGGKALFDKTPEGRKMDFVPALAISLVTVFWHFPMYRQGAQERNYAIQQDGFEIGGAWMPVILGF